MAASLSTCELDRRKRLDIVRLKLRVDPRLGRRMVDPASAESAAGVLDGELVDGS